MNIAPGIAVTEPRWVRAIEIRPHTVKGRRITHHAIAYLEQDPCSSGHGRLARAEVSQP